ncbi:DNA/RNA helicase domain-containing protein [Staphylococcus simulans]
MLKNELNVLLTRGVNGLYIYAVDEALQNELKRAANGGIDHE